MASCDNPHLVAVWPGQLVQKDGDSKDKDNSSSFLMRQRKNHDAVVVSNFGQSELLANLVCAAKSRNLDISSILVFTTDMETKKLAEHLGLIPLYDEWVHAT